MLRAAIVSLSLLLPLFGWAGVARAMPGATESRELRFGQRLIDDGQYVRAVRVFSRIIEDHPTEIAGYRGRIEALLLLGRYSDAVRDYARVTAYVLPAHPDAADVILAEYAVRLAASPDDVPALTGGSFANWWFFDYHAANRQLQRLLAVRPHDVYGHLFRGSSLLLAGVRTKVGTAELETAIGLAPHSADVRYVVADAYTYGLVDAERAFAEAMLALAWGLDTPRVRAILANAYLTFGEEAAAAEQFERHLELVTDELVTTAPLAAGQSRSLDLVPGRMFDIPVSVGAGQTLSLTTDSPSGEIFDSILVVLAPDGTPVTGNDDFVDYFAGLEWVAPASGVYRVRVSSFEGVGTGELLVKRAAP